jgi:tRNA A-37 threonylcarbamoyl transferase component Bud32
MFEAVLRTFIKNCNQHPWSYERRIRFLCALHPYHGFPKLIRTDAAKGELTLTWCGISVETALYMELTSIPLIRYQLSSLISILEAASIRHRDITKFNLLWHENQGLHLIDFGWSTWGHEDDSVVPIPWLFRSWMCDLTDRELATATVWQLEHDKALPSEELAQFKGKGL